MKPERIGCILMHFSALQNYRGASSRLPQLECRWQSPLPNTSAIDETGRAVSPGEEDTERRCSCDAGWKYPVIPFRIIQVIVACGGEP